MLQKYYALFLAILVFNPTFSQIGVNTNSPQSALDIQSDTLGLTVPRVSQIQDHVRSIGGSQPVMGTIVFSKLDSSFYGFDGELWYKFQFESSGFAPENSPPQISAVALNGSPHHGNTISASYTYFDVDEDEEGATTFNWYYKQGGSYILDEVNAAGNSYTIDTITTHTIGDSIKVEILPAAISGQSPGERAASQAR